MRPKPTSCLPEPDADALAHSARVVDRVGSEIEDAGGWISFAHYMQQVLYAPGLGYYVAGARKFGADGDFVTAPEMTPLFARALAAPVSAGLARTRQREVLELGAGSGALAAQMLNALAAVNEAPSRYRILEVSPELRQRQRSTIERQAPAQIARVEWIDAVPSAIDGVVVLNEVLDAVPPHVVVRRAGHWYERGVVCNGGLRWEERPLADAALRALADERFPPGRDYTSEVNPAAEALVELLAQRMTAGVLLVIDYGFPQHEYYHEQRSDGTLMVHYRHRAHADPFLWPGLADLTAHVDFTAIALAGERGGLTLAGYGPLAAFLVGSGILDRLRECGDPSTTAYLREASAVQKLVSPAEMGELFKVLALARDDGIVWPYFAEADRSHRL
ncbi:MAG: SAM-dependent methyltransferase [Burkholderiales bacterium]|nr:SAM-dependent methyltransferase [Burkholderiales bacterium]